MTRPIRIGINGFGRIGRTILRQLMTTRRGLPIEVAAINDIAPLDSCAYLFAYDSVFGPFPGPVTGANGALVIGETRIPVTHSTDLAGSDLAGIDIWLECAGHAKTRAIAERGLAAGAGRVLISGPSDAADATIVLGANDALLADQPIVSNASCTTNAEAPLLRLLHDRLGIEAAHLTTIHCYTASQPMIDAPRGDLARSRAGALSMVPTTTSATELIRRILPDLKGQLSSASVRVPVASVSAVDMTATLSRPVTHAELIALLRSADPAIIGHIDAPLVSSDLRGRPESLIVALPETMLTTDRQIRIFGWYDNEWGFSARMIDMVLRMGPQHRS